MGNVAKTFEELHIYQRARELTNHIYSITRTVDFAKDFGLVDRIRRAAVSVMSNTAEGFERGSKTEFIQFLYIAKGSCGEVRAQLQIAQDQKYIDDSQYNRLYSLAGQISAMISNFIGRLYASSYQGEKTGRPQRLALESQQKFLEKYRPKFDTPKFSTSE